MKKKKITTELTWEEKNPISYIFVPSPVFKELKRREEERIKREK